MPPRRSSRNSVEPSPTPASTSRAAPKRKRGSTVEPEPEPSKPAVRRASARKVSNPMPEIHEDSDDDEDDASAPPVAPPKKRTRPSSSDDEDSDASVIAEAAPPPPPPPPKRAPTRKTPAAKKAAQEKEVPMYDVSSDSDDDRPPPPPKAKPARKASVASAKTASAATSRRASVRAKVEDEDDKDFEEKVSVEPAPRARRGSAKPPTRRTSRQSVDVKPESDEDAPPPSTTKAGRSSAKAGPSRHQAAIPEADDEEAEVDEAAGADLTQPTPTAAKEEDEEGTEALKPTARLAEKRAPVVEEQSLLEGHVSVPPRSQQKQTIVEPEKSKGPVSRLVIHKLVLNNFKSYAGRQEIGPFHKSFSAIVGPNGSGKSNTIDALLFVFGWRASKMRQGKLSELIHNSAGFEDLDFCSVEVHFREIIDLPGPDAFEVVPNSDIVVARTAYKSNASKYTINGGASSFTDVRTLLLGRGIDLQHKRFLILQGEVESIALMKPKAGTEHEEGLLEYLEDIIGTAGYKAPIDAALAAMDALAEERAEKLGRLRITERERAALAAQKREAEDHLRLQNELVRAQSKLWQWYIWRAFRNLDEYGAKIAETEGALTELREQNQDDVDHLKELQAHFEKRETAYEEVKAAAAEAQRDLTVHEKEEAGLEERKKYSSTQAKKLRKALQDDRKGKKDAERAIEENAGKIKKEKASVRALEGELGREEAALEEITEGLKGKTQVFHDQIEAKQKELQPWTTKIDRKEADRAVAQGELEGLFKKTESAEVASQEADEQLQQLQTARAVKDKDLQHVETERTNVMDELQTKQTKLQGFQARVQKLREAASSSRQRVDEARSSQMAASTQNRVLDSLTNLKHTGRIKGFHGRLGSLGTIPEKYDVAVSTACGSLNNMVVDTVDQGQGCIEYLRQQNVGRASFIVLEKIGNHLPGMAKIPTPENVPRLFDLITPKDARFAPAFYKGVQDTLVAKDLEQANRIAFGGHRRWRVVTLAGQLIDASGTMSGGGSAPARGGMSARLQAEAVPPETLHKYEQDSERAARELEAVLIEVRQLEGEVEHLARAGPQLDLSLSKIKLEIQANDRKLSEATKRAKHLRTLITPDAADVARQKRLKQDIASAEAALDDLRAKSAGISADIAALEQKILDIGGTRLLKQKSTVDGLRLRIKLANDEITKAEVAEAKAVKDAAKHADAIETGGAALEEIEAELEMTDAALETCKEYLGQLRVNVRAAQEAADRQKEDLDNLTAQLQEKTEGIQEFRSKEVKLETKLGELQKEAAENERTTQHYQDEHDKLALEDVDDEDEEEDGGENAKVAEALAAAEDEEVDDKSKVKLQARSDGKLHNYTTDELSGMNRKQLLSEVALYQDQVANSRPNMGVLEEYRRREEEFLRRAKDLDETTARRDEEKNKYDELRKQRLDEFMTGFHFISTKLKEMYQMITLGGNAELELVDSMDPFSEGIIFSVMPPKKSWKNISNLSGGEKTLSSLALVFALHHFKPTPLYFMDEIDAALDFRNVSIVANYIKDRTKNAQFIIISLRNDMFELSHRLIGIYKTSNMTKSVSINNHALQTQEKTSAIKGSQATKSGRAAA